VGNSDCQYAGEAQVHQFVACVLSALIKKCRITYQSNIHLSVIIRILKSPNYVTIRTCFWNCGWRK
jgi:hypothetical protein